jgi:DNA-directed RNA polymerase subunit RPC12/RpoP
MSMRFERELHRKGIELLGHTLYRCKACGQRFSPNLLPGGRLPRNSWKCPNGCNHRALEDAPVAS